MTAAIAAPTAQPIDTAPHTDAWLLGYVPKLASFGYTAWTTVTWGDRGWMNDDGDEVEPTLWTLLPDPQPARTGWMPAEGTIHLNEITGEGWKINGVPAAVPYRWEVYILRTDGSYDEYRETLHYVTYQDGEARATKLQAQFGLPIEVKFLDPKVTPLFPRSTVQ